MSLSSLCLLLGYTRQAFYGYQNYQLKEALEAELIVQEVLKHRTLHPRIGTRKLVELLQHFTKQHKIYLGRDALFNLLRQHNLLIEKRKRKVQTTFFKQCYKKVFKLDKKFHSVSSKLPVGKLYNLYCCS